MGGLCILWTTEEREVAVKVVFPFLLTGMANGWWPSMKLIIWGPSVRLVARDPEIAQLLRDVMDCRIPVEACRLCADQYGVTGFYEDMGIPVLYVGASLSAKIQEGEKVITF
jgi:hypothetical protein